MKDEYIEIAVCGLHMRGLELNHQLTDLGAYFVREDKTDPCYRMKVIPQEVQKPFLMYSQDGFSLAVEVWKIPESKLGLFLAGIPAPLGLGKIRLESGEVIGFTGQAGYGNDYADISEYGGWSNYLNR